MSILYKQRYISGDSVAQYEQQPSSGSIVVPSRGFVRSADGVYYTNTTDSEQTVLFSEDFSDENTWDILGEAEVLFADLPTQTTITDVDDMIPTSGAVVDYVETTVVTKDDTIPYASLPNIATETVLGNPESGASTPRSTKISTAMISDNQVTAAKISDPLLAEINSALQQTDVSQVAGVSFTVGTETFTPDGGGSDVRINSVDVDNPNLITGGNITVTNSTSTPGNITFDATIFRVAADVADFSSVLPGQVSVVSATEQYLNISDSGVIFSGGAPFGGTNVYTNEDVWTKLGDGSGGGGADLSSLTSNPLNYGVGVARPIGTEVTWENSLGQAFTGNVDDILRSTRFENISTTGTETNSLFPSILIEEVPVAIYNDWITADADTFPGFLVLQELVERGRNLVVEIQTGDTVNGSTADFRDVTADIIELAVPTVNNTSDNIVNGYTITHDGVAAIATTDTAQWNIIEVADARRVLTHIVQHGDETLEVTTDMTVNRQLNVASINPSRDTGEPQFNVFTDEGEFTTTVIPVADNTTLRFSTADNTTIRDVFDSLGNGEGELFCTLQDTSIAAQITITETGVGNIYRVTAAGLGGVTIERATLTDGSGFTEATGANLVFTFFTGIQTTANRVLFPGDVEFLGSVFGIDEAAIDQTYDATSIRAQSGTAVAEAITTHVGIIEIAGSDNTFESTENYTFADNNNEFTFDFTTPDSATFSVDFTVETGFIGSFSGTQGEFRASEWTLGYRATSAAAGSASTEIGTVTQGQHTGNFTGTFTLTEAVTSIAQNTEYTFVLTPGVTGIVIGTAPEGYSIRVHESYDGAVQVRPGTRQAIEDIAGSGGGGGTTFDPTTLGGDITVTGTTVDIDDNTIGLGELSATGNTDNTTFLRGDNTWAVPAGGADLSTSSIDALSDVDTTTTTPTQGQLLSWNGADTSPQWVPVDNDIDTVNDRIEHLTLESLANVTENDVTGITTADFTLRDTDTAFLNVRGSSNIYLLGDVRSEITIGDRFYPIIDGNISADLYTVVDRVALDGANTEVFGVGTSQAFINLVVAANRGGNPFTGFYFLPDTITGWHEETSFVSEGRFLLGDGSGEWTTVNDLPDVNFTGAITKGGVNWGTRYSGSGDADTNFPPASNTQLQDGDWYVNTANTSQQTFTSGAWGPASSITATSIADGLSFTDSSSLNRLTVTTSNANRSIVFDANPNPASDTSEARSVVVEGVSFNNSEMTDLDSINGTFTTSGAGTDLTTYIAVFLTSSITTNNLDVSSVTGATSGLIYTSRADSATYYRIFFSDGEEMRTSSLTGTLIYTNRP